MKTEPFNQMMKRWHALSVSEDMSEDLDELERRIIDHTPMNSAEAADILSVLAQSLEGDVRCDGADINALLRLSAWLKDPSDPKSIAA